MGSTGMTARVAQEPPLRSRIARSCPPVSGPVRNKAASPAESRAVCVDSQQHAGERFAAVIGNEHHLLCRDVLIGPCPFIHSAVLPRDLQRLEQGTDLAPAGPRLEPATAS
ncbi:hypothetical protein GCM10023205_04050 [Yinghuangia aomiensis]|uniref:Uncharacterized protein n=1 Tax=Yinghuangia aomiensis TaxID=676205 RepID=A0ABP9GPX7_9ACTN